MIDLKNSDCFEYINTLKDESIDLVCIDPPYQISRDTGMETAKKSGKSTDRFCGISYNFGDWDNTEVNLDKLFTMLYPKMSKSSTLICFYDLWKITKVKVALEASKFQKLRFAEWIKTNPVPINSKCTYLSNAREIFVVATKGKGIFNSSYDKGIYEYGICADKGRFHPTQKPLQLIKDLILKHSAENSTILDCFSGSGTTAVACKELNRNFFGCELNKCFYEKSLSRLNEDFKNEKNKKFKFGHSK